MAIQSSPAVIANISTYIPSSAKLIRKLTDQENTEEFIL
jgi:hypothetical protein